MNRDFLVKLTPRNARLLTYAMETCNVDLDPAIMMLTKQDRIKTEEFDSLAIKLDDVQRQLVQFLIDYRFRASVPYDNDQSEPFLAILASLLLGDEKKVLFYSITGAERLIPPFIHLINDPESYDPSHEGWKWLNSYAEPETLIKYRDHVLVSEGLDDSLLGRLFPKIINFDRMSTTYRFSFLNKVGEGRGICAARHMASVTYPAVVSKMPTGVKASNFKKRGYGLFPLMGAFNKYLNPGPQV